MTTVRDLSKLPKRLPPSARFAAEFAFTAEDAMTQVAGDNDKPPSLLFRIIEDTTVTHKRFAVEMIEMNFGFGDRARMSAADQIADMDARRFRPLASYLKHVGLAMLCPGYTIKGELTEEQVEEITSGDGPLPPGQPFMSCTAVMLDGWKIQVIRRGGSRPIATIGEPGRLPGEMETNQLLGPLGWLNKQAVALD